MAFSEPGALMRHDLGSSGEGWLRSALRGGGALGDLLSGQLGPGSGKVFTFVPPEIGTERIQRWEEGGLIRGSAAMDRLVQLLRPALHRPHRYLIAEHAMARLNDPVLRTLAGRRLAVGDEVYEFVGPNSTNVEISDCLRRADAGYTLNAVVAELPRAPQKHEDPAFLHEIISRPAIVIVRAYDGEGFVLWERP